MLIFVYGTLRKDQGNHWHLENAEFKGEGRTHPNFFFVSMGGYPAMFPGGTTAVKGELYEATPEMVRSMDNLEGHPDYYRRTPIVLEDGVECSSYLLQHPDPGRPHILHGDWVKYRNGLREEVYGE